MVRRVLLDTHIVIWLATEPKRVPAHLQKLIYNAERRYVSVISCVEIALKQRRHPSAFTFTVELLAKAMVELQALELPLQHAHGVRLAAISMHHYDPFDHLLIAQAIEEQLTFVTVDSEMAAYAQDGLILAGKR